MLDFNFVYLLYLLLQGSQPSRDFGSSQAILERLSTLTASVERMSSNQEQMLARVTTVEERQVSIHPSTPTSTMNLLCTTLCRLVKGYLPPLPHAPLTVRKLVYFCCCDACRLRSGACMPCYSPYLPYIYLGVPGTALLLTCKNYTCKNFCRVKCIGTPQSHCRSKEYNPRCYSFFFLTILLRL